MATLTMKHVNLQIILYTAITHQHVWSQKFNGTQNTRCTNILSRIQIMTLAFKHEPKLFKCKFGCKKKKKKKIKKNQQFSIYYIYWQFGHSFKYPNLNLALTLKTVTQTVKITLLLLIMY